MYAPGSFGGFGRRINMAKNCSGALVILLSAGVTALASQSVSAQSIMNGVWNSVFTEDIGDRGGGPEPGDYTGVPTTAASRSVAQTGDAQDVTLPEWQCRPHLSHYGIRGPGPIAIREELDPQTLAQVALRTHMIFPQRDIWMDDRPEPPEWAAHTWSGFSKGRWIAGDVLRVHTTKYKRGWIKRNGLPTSDEAVFDEYFMRYGDLMTHIGILTDPEYLSEPLVRSTTFEWVTNWPRNLPFACRPLIEVPRSRADLPMLLPNQTAVIQSYAVKNNVPMEAALGSAETLLPEYQDKMATLPPNPPVATIEKLEREQNAENARRPR